MLASRLSTSDRRTAAFLLFHLLAIPVLIASLQLVHRVWEVLQGVIGSALPLWLGQGLGFTVFAVAYVALGYRIAGWLRQHEKETAA